ncbi:MAG: glycoside hydrolase family 97 protein [Cyclobacteriaceae bacterium]|nr:glycoside hydrolase family 97 protein [Cyclobacteriaceae bacterium]
MKFIAVLTLLLLNACFLFAQKTFTVSSPSSSVLLQVSQKVDGSLYYAVKFKRKNVIIPSMLGLKFSNPAVTLSAFQITSVDSLTKNETWKPVWGETSSIRNHYKELKLTLIEKSGSDIQVTITFRVFNDGVGFRYEFPQQPNLNHFILADELTQFALTGDHKTFWIPGDYDSNEYLYNTSRLSEIDALTASTQEPDIAVKSVFDANAVQTPLMMKSADGLYISLHEAALINYPAMNLVLDKKNFTFTTHLVPDAAGNKAYLQTPARTPWRTILISDKATDILDSKMILNLNDPSVIDDPSWIKPQKFIGVWWEMHIGKGTWDLASGKHAANTENVKRYIDFASRFGFDGVLVEGWNVGWEDWFGNWKENVFDFITPYSDYDIQYLTAYAKQKGVRIIMHHETSGSVTNYERWMEKAYQYMVDHDMNAVKTGYVGKIIPRGEHHDGQWMVNHYQRVAEKTASYKIMLDAHEPVRSTGLHRTYPNWLASEAARGSEFNNAGKLGMTPEHTTILPFTRLLGGPMDFTPGLFHLQLNQFEKNRTQRVRSTLAKQLALYITMYSPLQMAADLPENYEKYLDAFQFIVDVPVDWDDSRTLEGEPGDFITIVRKAKGKDDWYLGAITDENSRSLKITLDFLETGRKYEAFIYRDSEKADWETNPESYTIEKRVVTSKTKLNIWLANGGGCAIRIIMLPK